jgi:hypothetical protein
MADKGGLQLLPDTRKRIDVKVPGQNRLIVVGVFLLIVVVVASGVLWIYKDSLTNQIADADASLAALEKQRDKKAEEKLLTLSKEIGITNQILKSHVYWSTGFSKIEAALQNNVQFESFSGSVGDQAIHFRALADNYTTIARQIAALVTDDSITDVNLDGVNSLTNGKLDFSAKISFILSKFLSK